MISTEILPVENVVLCLSLFAVGLKMLIPLLRFEFEKCLMNVASTLSMTFVTYEIYMSIISELNKALRQGLLY